LAIFFGLAAAFGVDNDRATVRGPDVTDMSRCDAELIRQFVGRFSRAGQDRETPFMRVMRAPNSSIGNVDSDAGPFLAKHGRDLDPDESCERRASDLRGHANSLPARLLDQAHGSIDPEPFGYVAHDFRHPMELTL